MKIRGKEIKEETISMWLNIFGFLIGILFYFRLENNSRVHLPPPQNAVHDSVLIIDTKLHEKIEQLEKTQEKLIKQIEQNSASLQTQNRIVTVVRYQLQKGLKTDWDSLSQREKNTYVNQIIQELKTQKNQ